MFKNNKYTTWYFSIINNAKQRINEGYVERHHIIPKCLGGSDDKWNKVELSAREHFICHLLLTKMSEEPKLKFALHVMSITNHYQKERYAPSSRIYEYIKKCNSLASSARMAGFRGHNLNKVRIHNSITGETKFVSPEVKLEGNWKRGWGDDFKQTISKALKGRVYYHNPSTKEVRNFNPGEEIPNGWVKGNPSADTSSTVQLKGSAYYHDPVSGEETRVRFNKGEEIPNGYAKGRSVKWITDGTTNKQINAITEKIPNGWKLGRTMNWKRNQKKYE